MSVHLEPGSAENCVGICDGFADALEHAASEDTYMTSTPTHGSFDTARQLSAVYELFAGDDLRRLLHGFVDQAKAMSMLFAAAGGLIEAQDEELASALSRASAEPVELQSLGVMSSLAMLAAPGLAMPEAELAPLRGGYDRVGPEDVSGASLEQMASGARALDEAQFRQVATRVGSVADTLEDASGQLQSGLGAILGQGWQGDFAARAGTSVAALTKSATELAGALRQAAGKADGAADGFTVTRQNVSSQASEYALVQQTTPGAGPMAGPATQTQLDQVVAARAAAEEQARAVINTEYSPAVMDANLNNLDFPHAYRVVSSSGLGGPGGVDLNTIWNQEGVIRPAEPGTPPQATLTALTGGGPGDAGVAASGATAAAGAGVGVPASAGVGAAVPVDAGTEQALHTSRQGAGAGAAAAAAGTGPGGAGTPGAGPAGVNASTAAAAGAPLLAPGTQHNGAAATAGARAGGRHSSAGNDRGDRGFGTAAGLVGGGGAAAAGAGAASRMGGAGTLSGIGGPAAPVSPPATGTAPAAAGPASSSTTGANAGRMGAMPMGMMGAAGAAGRNDSNQGHQPASYLVNATNTSAIVGDPVKVTPPKIGALPDAAPPPAEPAPAPISPAQALINKLKNR